MDGTESAQKCQACIHDVPSVRICVVHSACAMYHPPKRAFLGHSRTLAYITALNLRPMHCDMHRSLAPCFYAYFPRSPVVTAHPVHIGRQEAVYEWR